MLGAGLDSNALRNADARNSVSVFEVDDPPLQRWKRERLNELGISVPAALHFVPCNFEDTSFAAISSLGKLRDQHRNNDAGNADQHKCQKRRVVPSARGSFVVSSPPGSRHPAFVLLVMLEAAVGAVAVVGGLRDCFDARDHAGQANAVLRHPLQDP